MRCILGLFCFLTMSFARATTPVIPSDPFKLKIPYIDGRSFCSGAMGSMNEGEHGHFISVPVSYESYLSPRTDIYAWTFKVFDPLQPTAIVFSGGPGENLHEGISMLNYFPNDWNVIFFDPRGMLCSRPTNSKLLQDNAFVSSEIIARDSQQIASFFNLEKWTAFGVSYGTVAATIAGHLFPSSIQSLVLQGTLFSTETSDVKLIPIAQAIFDHLPRDQRDKIISVTTRTDIDMIQEWAFDFIFLGSYGNNLIEKRFEKLFAKPESEVLADIRDFLLEIKNDGYVFLDSEDNSSWFRTVLSCRERVQSRIDVQFKSGIFYSGPPHPDQAKIEFCRQFDIQSMPYRAYKYPVIVPVTYFQGDLDMATPRKAAHMHFRHVAKGRAQFVSAPTGGHMVLNPSDFGSQYAELMRVAFAGEKISEHLIQESNLEGGLQLQLETKH